MKMIQGISTPDPDIDDGNKKQNPIVYSLLMIMIALFTVCVVVITILSVTIVDLNKQIETLERCDEVITNCPVCGNDVTISTTSNAFYIDCDECHLYTGGYDSKSELIEAWEKISK